MKRIVSKPIQPKAITPSGCNGFSLIELMIVVAIIGIAAAFAAPNFAAWVANTKTRSIAEAIQNGVQRAQGEAVKRGVRVQFVLTDNDPVAKGVAESATGKNWVIQTMLRESPSTVDAFVEGASLGAVSSTSLVSAGSATITFNSFGRVEAPAGGVTYTLVNTAAGSNARTLKVQVSPSGSVRMCDDAFVRSSNPLGC